MRFSDNYSGKSVDEAGNIHYFLKGKRHRENGPASIYTDGLRLWFLNGKHIECSSQKEFERYLRLKAFW